MVVTILSVALAIVASLAVVALVAYRSAANRLRRFSEIADVDAYRTECLAESERASSERDAAVAETASLGEQLDGLKQTITQYQAAVHDYKSLADLRRDLKQLRRFAEGCKTLGELSAKIEHHQALVAQLTADVQRLGYEVDAAKGAGDVKEQIRAKLDQYHGLRREVLALEEKRDLQEYGFYERKYDLGASDRYKARLDRVRAQQKDMIKDKTAATCDTEWTVAGSAAKGRQMVNDQIKLLLRAFNGESDASVAKVTHSNATAMDKRIQRSFDQINRMGKVNQVHISRPYLELKLEELYLTHEHRLQKEEEKEQQRQIKAQMREEARVEKEIEKAKADAERDENARRDALEKARAELSENEGRQTAKLEGLVAKLESELQEAIDRKAKAIARAQLTRSGHVYVLSNIGSFGEGVYKIGMTRRLEPSERVKELGSASVPFLFDVHAMIYSEDAPALETALHRHFNDRRVNCVNSRKEFFRVSLEEIREAVADKFGTVTFTLDHEADEYRQSVARLAELEAASRDRQLVAS